MIDASEQKVAIFHLRRTNAELMGMIRSGVETGADGAPDPELLRVIEENMYCLETKRERLRCIADKLLRAGWLDDASIFDVDDEAVVDATVGAACAAAAVAAPPPPAVEPEVEVVTAAAGGLHL